MDMKWEIICEQIEKQWFHKTYPVVHLTEHVNSKRVYYWASPAGSFDQENQLNKRVSF